MINRICARWAAESCRHPGKSLALQAALFRGTCHTGRAQAHCGIAAVALRSEVSDLLDPLSPELEALTRDYDVLTSRLHVPTLAFAEDLRTVCVAFELCA